MRIITAFQIYPASTSQFSFILTISLVGKCQVSWITVVYIPRSILFWCQEASWNLYIQESYVTHRQCNKSDVPSRAGVLHQRFTVINITLQASAWLVTASSYFQPTNGDAYILKGYVHKRYRSCSLLISVSLNEILKCRSSALFSGESHQQHDHTSFHLGLYNKGKTKVRKLFSAMPTNQSKPCLFCG